MSIIKKHLWLNIQETLNIPKNKKINFFTDDDDYRNKFTDEEARAYLKECQNKGWEIIPCGSDCEGFDHFGGGCPGRLVLE